MRILKKSFLLILSLVLISLCACVRSDDTQNEPKEFVVLKSKTDSSLVKVNYEIKGVSLEEKTDELINYIRNYDGKDYIKPISEEVELLGWNIEDDQANVYFGQTYNDIKPSDEVLLRASIVETLCQLSEIKAVCFFVDDSPLAVKGNIIGRMDDDMFINGLNMVEGSTKFKLYFPKSDYTKLVFEEREVKLSSIVTDELAVMEAVIKGPETKGLVGAIPEGTKVLNIVTKDRVCYVNLGGKFLDYQMNVPAEYTIYSIVNSLCSLPGVTSVVITYEGQNLEYYNSSSINGNLLYNYELVNE